METVCYILMGLSVLVVFKQLFALSPTACYWIIAEGVCYITGAAFYSLRKADVYKRQSLPRIKQH